MYYRERISNINGVLPNREELDHIERSCSCIHRLCSHIPQSLWKEKLESVGIRVRSKTETNKNFDCDCTSLFSKWNHSPLNNDNIYSEDLGELNRYVDDLLLLFEEHPRAGDELMRILDDHGIHYDNIPKRNFRGSLQNSLSYWTEKAPDAANTSLFSSVGIWTSPSLPSTNAMHGVIWMTFGCLLIAIALATELLGGRLVNFIFWM